MALQQRSFREESLLAPEAATTFDEPAGFAVLGSFGFVRTEAVVARSFFRTTFRTLGALVGLSPTEILTDAERGRSEALHALLELAYEVGANSVVRLRFDASERADGSTLVAASGEALLLDPAPGFAVRPSRK